MELLTDASRANKANTPTSEVKQKTHTDGTQVILNTHSTYQYFHWVLPLDLLSPSALCESVMLGWAGFAADGNDGIG